MLKWILVTAACIGIGAALYLWSKRDPAIRLSSPTSVSDLDFMESSDGKFPFREFYSDGKMMESKMLGTFSYCHIGLGGDRNLWIIVGRRHKSQKPGRYHFLTERDGKLIYLLQTEMETTLIPKKDSMPDIEDWIRSRRHNSDAVMSNREYWTYSETEQGYERLWTETYEDGVLIGKTNHGNSLPPED